MVYTIQMNLEEAKTIYNLVNHAYDVVQMCLPRAHVLKFNPHCEILMLYSVA
jgi:hypothetical protein